MTKRNKKLSLNRETLRTLEPNQLAKANGGTDQIQYLLNFGLILNTVDLTGLPPTTGSNIPGCNSGLR